jgi:coproporphyrinogen III oxidase
MLNKENIAHEFRLLQASICEQLEKTDGKAGFGKDEWMRPDGGGGITRILESGNLIEKGGVNFSEVWGKTPEKIKQGFSYDADHFYATGVSIVLHPVNPHVPIIHMNIRYFELNDDTWWYGGGIDLTPHYVDVAEARKFHGHLRKICDSYNPDYYGRFKAWADDYFYIKHRKETRGVGGIFFDRLTGKEQKDLLFDFVMDVGRGFVPLYSSIVEPKRNLAFDDIQKIWQMIRRGRYVEFNLVLDRGTKFGLESDGRIESILMSMPPLAAWQYDFTPEENSPEWQTQRHLKKHLDWISA